MNTLTKLIIETAGMTGVAAAVLPVIAEAEAARITASYASVEMAQTPQTIYAAIPPGAGDEADQTIMQAIEKLALEVEPGSRVSVIDGISQRTLAEFTTPTKGAKRVKQRAIRGALRPVEEFMSAAPAGQSEIKNAVHLPALLDTVGTSVRGSGKGARLVVYGSLYYVDEYEPAASFRPGQVPSPGHALASSRHSVYGTRDRPGLLENVAVDLVTLGERVGNAEQRAVEEFWSFTIGEFAGALTSVAPYPDVAHRLIINQTTDAMPFAQVDLTDTVIEIRDVRPPAPPPAPGPVVIPEPVVAPQPAPFVPAPTAATVDLVWVIDGSGSMSHAHEQAKVMTRELIELGARLTPGLRVGFVIYRGPGDMSVMPLTPMNPPINGAPSYGSQVLDRFIEGDVAPDGHGGRRHVSPFESWGGHVDTEGGIAEALRLLERGTGDRKVFLMMADIGPIELDGSPVVSEGDKRACRSAEKIVRWFVESQDDARIVTVFMGQEKASDDATRVSVAFFKTLSGLSGDRGAYTADLDDLEDIVKRAMLAD